MNDVHAGLDIGGQTIKGVCIDSGGEIVARASCRTFGEAGAGARSASGVLDSVRGLLAELSRGCRVRSVGVGTPGGVDGAGRIVGEAANIPGWVGTDLGAAVVGMTGASCVVRNDGNMAAYGEWAARKGRGALLFVGLGTGIGGGYVHGGHILGGREDRALEIGHLVVEYGGRHCACGVAGCAEAYASGLSTAAVAADLARGETVLGRRYRRAGEDREGALETVRNRVSDPVCGTPAGRSGGAGDPVRTLPGHGGPSGLSGRIAAGAKPDAREVYAAFASGDPLAILVDDIVCEALARAVAAAVALLAPDMVVFGGGVVAGAPHLATAVGLRTRRYVYADALAGCEFDNAVMPGGSGLAGAALLGASRILDSGGLFTLAARVAARWPAA